jgi:hypothetical protein
MSLKVDIADFRHSGPLGRQAFLAFLSLISISGKRGV